MVERHPLEDFTTFSSPAFRYDSGTCVGGYTVWAKKVGDTREWSPMSWSADTGTGRVSVQQLKQEYAAKNADLPWP